MSHARRTPLAIHSSIFALASFRLSLGERTSTTNSGERRRYFLRSCLVRLLRDSFETQAASGDRPEPSGRKNCTLEPNPLPRPSFLAQTFSSVTTSELR